jgi:hypothetical protein
MIGCHSKQKLFNKIDSGISGIHFNNVITENDSINPIDKEFLYNGGGVAAGDFNNDGLQDLYFTAGMVSNKLYLNKGGFAFKDVTETAGVGGKGRWCDGASVVDINNDGLLDIYVCVTIKTNPAERTNLLYINQGLNKDHVPIFKEMAAEYGLADTSYSVQAAFFDYDNDGDLDMYLLTTKMAQRDATQFGSDVINKDSSDVDRLYRNDWNDSLGHPVFTNVSAQAGIVEQGYGLGVSISDINQDGWKDIYVSNDFYGSDQLYINNKNGTFSNKVREYFKHTSQNAMGNDVADINNDGLADILTLDMAPAVNLRRKKNMNPGNYAIYQNMIKGSYMLQYVRNTLQLNQGPRLNEGDSAGDPIFSEIAFYAGIAETDWSWNVSLADFDNDGYRDIFITNGYPKDITDHDFGAFRRQSSDLLSKKSLSAQIPQIKIPNYVFKNDGNLQFEDMSSSWGLNEPSFSNGAIYVDLDNDGDLDYVVNNINEEAFLYENRLITRNQRNVDAGFLDIQFVGEDKNVHGLGAIAAIYYGHGRMQLYENSPYRGYLSTTEAKAHFGLGSFPSVDSVVIEWPNRKRQVLYHVAANQVLQVNIKDAPGSADLNTAPTNDHALFTDVTSSTGIRYVQQESDYIDFDVERLLPHKLSQYGPGLAVADVDGNGLDDIFIAGSQECPARFLMQQRDGTFIGKELPMPVLINMPKYQNMGVLLFDADGDGKPDLYCANGGNRYAANTGSYQDLFYINDGKGNFRADTTALPMNHASKSCVKAVDFDHDGDLDLFIGARVLPGKYPLPVSSFIYRNDSEPGRVHFTDVTDSVAKDLLNIGMICDATWTDFDNDGWTDLVVAGEWMPLTFLKNDHGKFVNITDQSGVKQEIGWWNSIAAGDFDNDGDIDYIAGNLGLNSFYRASAEHPVSIYAKDFDKNGSFDALITLFLPDGNGIMREYPAASRDDIIKQLPGLRKKFPTYKDFGVAAITDLFPEEELRNACIYRATNFENCYLENLGHGKFKMHPLPAVAQLAPLYGMAVADYNLDGNLDIAVCGNDFGTEVTNGRYDALNGLLLLGDGRGNFSPQTILQSGIYVPGDAKALVKLSGPDNSFLLAASQNRGPLKIFRDKSAEKMIKLQSNDRILKIALKNGKTRKEELYYGSSFLSESSRFVRMNDSIKRITVIDEKGRERIVAR